MPSGYGLVEGGAAEPGVGCANTLTRRQMPTPKSEALKNAIECQDPQGVVMRQTFFCLVFIASTLQPMMGHGTPQGDKATEVAAVAAVLDDWHLAAAGANEDRYFDHFAESAVFLGTDPTERWEKAAFRNWAHPYFKRGKAWTFKSTRRVITVSAGGGAAWFDEDLSSLDLGSCRGTGVLTREKGRWVIQQYSLSVPVPNDLMEAVLAQIEVKAKTTQTQPTGSPVNIVPPK